MDYDKSNDGKTNKENNETAYIVSFQEVSVGICVFRKSYDRVEIKSLTSSSVKLNHSPRILLESNVW